MDALSRLALLALALVFMPVAPAMAEPVSYPELDDPVAGTDGVTFADLVRVVAPGIGDDGKPAPGFIAPDIPHLGGDEWGSLAQEEIDVVHVASLPVRSAGRDLLALLVDFGEARDQAAGLAVLALFEIAGGPRLVDAAGVGFDRSTGFADPVRLAAGSGDLLITRSAHSNAHQTYATTALILVRNDRLMLVDTIFTFDERDCAYEQTQRLDLGLGAREPFADIVATVTERTAPSGQDCGAAAAPPERAREVAVTYRWDVAAGRYVADSDALDQLARESEERF